jgi:hypothetical protein
MGVFFLIEHEFSIATPHGEKTVKHQHPLQAGHRR